MRVGCLVQKTDPSNKPDAANPAMAFWLIIEQVSLTTIDTSSGGETVFTPCSRNTLNARCASMGQAGDSSSHQAHSGWLRNGLTTFTPSHVWACEVGAPRFRQGACK